jgi:hypothetical protein
MTTGPGRAGGGDGAETQAAKNDVARLAVTARRTILENMTNIYPALYELQPNEGIPALELCDERFVASGEAMHAAINLI